MVAVFSSPPFSAAPAQKLVNQPWIVLTASAAQAGHTAALPVLNPVTRASLQKQLFQTAGSVAVAAGGTHPPLTSYKGPQHVGSDAGNSVVVGVAVASD